MDLRLWCLRLGSFGVAVLESVSGVKAVDFRQPEVAHAWLDQNQ